MGNVLIYLGIGICFAEAALAGDTRMARRTKPSGRALIYLVTLFGWPVVLLLAIIGVLR